MSFCDWRRACQLSIACCCCCCSFDSPKEDFQSVCRPCVSASFPAHASMLHLQVCPSYINMSNVKNINQCVPTVLSLAQRRIRNFSVAPAGVFARGFYIFFIIPLAFSHIHMHTHKVASKVRVDLKEKFFFPVVRSILLSSDLPKI